MSTAIKSKVIGVDIGVKTTTIAVVDLRGTILAKDYLPTADYPYINDFAEALSERGVTEEHAVFYQFRYSDNSLSSFIIAAQSGQLER